MEITLHWDRATPWASLEVCDAQGRTVLARRATGNSDELVDLSGLANGIYAVVVHDASGVVTQRSVKH